MFVNNDVPKLTLHFLLQTTLSGPGTVWLQGMPVDRMVSEIARKIPSGGGIGLGIPIMGGGGGGAEGSGEGAGDMAAGEVADGGDAEAPMTDAAIDSDRNATVASSGMTEPSTDPESSESLFGDAAFGGGSPPKQHDTTSSSSISSDEDSFSTTNDFSSQSSQSNESMNMPEFEEPTMVDEQFEDDGTTFSTYKGDGSTDMGESGSEMPTPDEEGSGLLGQLWDMFKDFTDDD